MSASDRPAEASAPRQQTSFEEALDRCRSVVDGAIAQRTIPTKLVERSRFQGTAPAASVEVEVWADHVAVKRRSDARARDRLVAHYGAHAQVLAKRFYRQREPLEDLQQVAMEALLLALERFDPEQRKPFFGFANPTIVGSLRRHYRDSGWSVKVPRRVHDLASTMRDSTELLTQDLGRVPTSAELADLMDVTSAEVERAQAAMGARSTDSIDVPLAGRSAGELFGEEDKQLSLAENWLAVQQALVHLTPEDRELLQLYFMEELTQTEIAQRTGVSQMHVSRSLARVLRQVRSHMRAE